MYDCKLMEIRRAFFVGWMGCGSALSLWWMVDGTRLPGCSVPGGGGVGRLAEVGIDEGWRIEWIPGSWMSHRRCAGWLIGV